MDFPPVPLMLDYLCLKEILVTSEITALEHELRDDTVETASGISLHQRTFQTPHTNPF